jgi:hypothetical protein
MKSYILSAVVILLAITACNGTFQIGLEHSTSTPTSVVSPTTAATTPIPTPTSQAVATATPSAVNIVMTPGTTAGVVQGTVQPGQVMTYTLAAGQSQLMILMMDSPNNDVTLGVFEPNGSKLLDPANQWTRWEGLLPRTELYTIQVIGGAATENYTLTAKVAQQVKLGPGAGSITLNGTTVNGYVFSYAWSGNADQTLTATLNVPSSTAYIDIFGLATGSLLSSTAKANTWTGVLPQTQGYVIEVIPNNGQVVNYSLTLSAGPALGDIVFTPGSTAGVVQGRVQHGQVVTYTLAAGQSQPMILIMDSPNNDVTLGVSEPNGSKLLDPSNKLTHWQGLLPRTELYTIQVIGGATTENYTLTAKVAQQVSLSSGSVILNGTTVNGYVFSYGFNWNANQTLTATLNVPSTTAYLDIFGLATGSLLSSTANANTWTGVLPQTQDYVIEVIPNHGQVVNYSLTVSIH